MRTLTQPGTNAHTPKPRPDDSRRTEPLYHIVRGRGWFPEDMLRYDRAWAITGINVGGDKAPEMLSTLQQKVRSVVVASWFPLTIKRWESFGWVVIDQDIPEPNFGRPSVWT